MKYIVKLLDDVQNINDFKEVEELTIVKGNSTRLYFRLMTEQLCSNGDPERLRYIPQGATNYIEVNFDNIDDDLAVCRVAVQAFADDKSIYYVPILAQDELAFNGMRVVVTEDSNVRNFIVITDLASQDTGERRFFT